MLTSARCSDCTANEVPWVVLIDTTDKSKPKIIDGETVDYVHTSTLDANTLYTNSQVAPFFRQTGNAHITALDVSDTSKPLKKGTIATPTSEGGLAHDTYIDNRPDGETLMYAASISKSAVIDILNPRAPTFMQTAIAPTNVNTGACVAHVF